ncbi:GGDEF domain-containing protein [Pararhodobacter zhoushanensis]|uniref:diguanylate cyclase n=1 Tax=Pararhodobacter zhoushanensis TaxID=2479545 RepID=A0ABT3H2R7_9RHOB|nr:diguanylate cyclase [Pararhodobacter zhoushanensis]MCW1934103.1 diguanylate cyclase [Pararhodobacter zhoushanensis]
MLQDLLTSLVYGLGLMGIAGISYGIIHRRTRNGTMKSVLIGLVFGVIAILAMVNPINLSEGIILDARAVIVGLASAFGGLPAAIISGLLVGLYRIHLGGAGAIPGAFGILISAGLGFAWHRFILSKSPVTLRQLLGLGALLSLHSIAILMLPMSVAIELFSTVVPVLTVSCIIGALVMGLIIDRERRYIRTEKFWRETAGTDSLTGLPNRRSFMDRLQLEPSPKMPGQYSAVMIIDIDHFKKVNDTYGHDAGDMALRRVADALQRTSGDHDFVCRLGGEEFAVFSENTSQDDIQNRAEAYRAAIERQLIRYGKKTIPLTISIGVASWIDALEMDVSEMLRNADTALYAAKTKGRNRVVIGGALPSSYTASA